jgi:hypothetical protein
MWTALPGSSIGLASTRCGFAARDRLRPANEDIGPRLEEHLDLDRGAVQLGLRPDENSVTNQSRVVARSSACFITAQLLGPRHLRPTG